MKAITPDIYDRVIWAAGLKAKFAQELRPRLDSIGDWDEREFVPIADRGGNRGVLWVECAGVVYLLPFVLSRGIVDKATGRARPVICDLCFTQQLGTSAGRLSISVPKQPETSRSILVCADLACSAHVRGKTAASLRSKAQLRENMSIEARIERLRTRLGKLISSLGVRPIL